MGELRGSRTGRKGSRRQVLPGLLPGINHNGSGFEVFGDRRRFGWGLSAMRIYGSNGAALASAPAAARRSAGGAFNVSEQDQPRNSTAAGSLRAISTVDALIALQGVEDPAERKKRAVVKGRNVLDVLDTLKLSVLDGS